MYVVLPKEQLHHEIVSANTYFYSIRKLQTTELDTWKFKTKSVATLATEDNRGAILSTSREELIELARKYGGVVQTLRDGKTIYENIHAQALADHWEVVGNPYTSNGIALFRGEKNMETSVTGKYRVRLHHRTNGVLHMTYIRYITDIPEVIELLGNRPVLDGNHKGKNSK